MDRRILEKKLLMMVEEDVGWSDITSELVPDKRVKAVIIAKEDCFVSGIAELKALFSLYGIDVLSSVEDGDHVKPKQVVFSLSGNSRNILVVERTALNILSRMSGVTSLTKAFVSAAKKSNPNVLVAATRKTTPLFGLFEKKAVSVGGGDPHRAGLYDMILLKSNHLKLFDSVRDAVKKAKSSSVYHKVGVEVSNVDDAIEAAESEADILLFDNMSVLEVKKSLLELKKKSLRDKVIVEVSGGITLENISSYAACGPDIISVGRLTHSAVGKDFALRIL